MQDDELASMRAEIDTLDRELLAVLAKRRLVVDRMRITKTRLALPRIDDAREARVRDRWLASARELALPEPLALALLDVVLADSRALVRG
jgi:chorismate mutase